MSGDLRVDTIGTAEIDLDAVRGNLAAIRRRAGATRRIIAMLKADAYGHGAVGIAKALDDPAIAYLATGSLDEALAVARVSATPILLLGSLPQRHCALIVANRLVASLDDAASVAALARAARERTVDVFIKVDCGFGRFGVALAEARSFATMVAAQRGLRLAGLYTHLPFADAAGRDWAARRGRAFAALVDGLARDGVRVPIVQVLASPGLLTGLDDAHNAVAVGHLLYGLTPVSAAMAADLGGFRPALRSIVSRLVHVGHVGDDDAPYLRGKSGALGVVPIGIAHGYRPAPGEGFVIVGGARAPVLRPCLEGTVIDLSRIRSPSPGMAVTVLGADGALHVTLDDLAAWQRTSPLALLTGLTKSLHRRYVGAGTST